jgi:acetyl esterase
VTSIRPIALVLLPAIALFGGPGQQTARAAAPLAAETSNTVQRANPDMRRVIEKLAELGAKPLGTETVAATRKGPTPADAVKAVLRDAGKDPAALMAATGVKIQNMSYPTAGTTQAIRIYTPGGSAAGQALPAIVFIHGGGWVIADLDTYESSAVALAKKTGAIVASVEYRHAPENRFPAAHDDTLAAYKWVLQNAASFGADPKRIAIAGESAGGNMALNVAIAARDQHLQMPLHMLLVYPVAGTDMTTRSYKENERAIPLSKQAMAWFVDNTVRSPADVNDPRLNIVGRANLRGLPPATIINAGIDPLASEGQLLTEKLKAAGVKAVRHFYPGVTHEFFGMDSVVADAATAQDIAARDLRMALGIGAATLARKPAAGR